MAARTRGRVLDGVIGLAILLMIVSSAMKAPPEGVQSEFSQSVDLTPLADVAVQSNGRIKSFDSFARSWVKSITGPRAINEQSRTFTYLDLLFRPRAYATMDCIYVKHKDVRERIIKTLDNNHVLPEEHLSRMRKSGLIPPIYFSDPKIGELLNEMEADLIRTRKPVRAIRNALASADRGIMLANLRLIPPAGDDAQMGWLEIDRLWTGGGMPQDSIHAGARQRATIPGLDAQQQDKVAAAWDELAAAWNRQDAPATTAAIAGLAGVLPALNSVLYPEASKLQLENWYFRYKTLVWTWMIYLLAIVPLLMAVIYHWRGARRLGLVIFLVAFGLHTASIAIRWHLSGRIPNSNIYEAVMAATWFGCTGALIIEFLVRKSAMRNLFALGAAVCAMVGMMCSYFLPVTLNSDINHVMPVLNDLWLYIHTNVIIFSYCLIGMAAVTALLYLRFRVGGGNSDYAKAGGAGEVILAGAPRNEFVKTKSSGMGQVLDGATMVLMELAFVLLWAGLSMGAIWADHSWGRPWGWDPKEVFALNTFIIFLILVHVRLKVKDKAFWTAILACVGCGVMLFNWIVVNFVITGLHSYA